MNRFKEVYEQLLKLRYVSTQQEFAFRVGMARTIVSQLLNEKRELTDKHIENICWAFPFVNEKWLRDGAGEMFSMSVSPQMTDEERVEYEKNLDIQFAEEEAWREEQERKASLYEAKSLEVCKLYSQLAEMMNRLHEKEKEIAELHLVIQSHINTIRLLRMSPASLVSQEKVEESAEDENT